MKNSLTCRRVLSLLMSVVLILSSLTFTANAATDDASPTPQEILAGCSVTLLKDGNFTAEDTGAELQVKLHSQVAKCYLTVFAYPSTLSFDPDSTGNLRLWSGMVTDGYHDTVTFNSAPKPGYKIIACLNVPVGEDYYLPSNSQAIEVVDENGQGFEDYTYPNVTIDETELIEGATSLHISLTGDERIFQAAQTGLTTVTCAVGQYPEGEYFDFEGENQISLVSNLTATEPFSGKEVTLGEPLRAGYRVRAVVYWRQNSDIFLPKGNDYEAMFGLPDDSVAITPKSQVGEPAAVIQAPVYDSDSSINISVTGSIETGSILLVKCYDADTTEFLSYQGTPLGVIQNIAATDYTFTPSANVAAGQKLVAFIMNSGEILAQSAPVQVEKSIPFEVSMSGLLSSDSTSVDFDIKALNSNITNINIIKLCKVMSNGSADESNPVARVFGKKPGNVTLDIPSGALSSGDKVRLVLTYVDGDVTTWQSQDFSVTAPLAEDSVAFIDTEFTTDSDSAKVVVSGCSNFTGGYLFVTMGQSSQTDADERKQIGSVKFTGEGTYKISFWDRSVLKEGCTLMPHLYKYDFDADTTSYKYGNQVTINAAGSSHIDPSVAIVTSQIQEDADSLWVTANYDSSLTGTLLLYCYAGDTYTFADLIYSGAISPSMDSQKITFGSSKLTKDNKIRAVLVTSDGARTESAPVTVLAKPEKAKPVAAILDTTITAGDTKLKAFLSFDKSISSATYKLYQYEGDVLDVDTAQLLFTGSLWRSSTSETIPVGIGRLKAGSKLQIVLTAGDSEAYSLPVTVMPSPDWGNPYSAFDISAVKADATELSLTVDYSDEYLTLGDEFYCDVSVYQFPGTYSDAEFEDKELWENFNITRRVAQANSTLGQQTKGKLTIPLNSSAVLTPGSRLIIKLRLPHTEWEGEEVDYLSASIPVISSDSEVPDYKVVLYNLGEDTSRGSRLRNILAELNIPVVTVGYDQLNETVGYLAGLDGYPAADQSYTGTQYDNEFMLMCNLPESLLDTFLDKMQENNLRIDHKAIVTEYNREYMLYELMGDIGDEHNVFTALINLNSLVKKAEQLTESEYGNSPDWGLLQSEIKAANALIASEEPTYEDLTAAYNSLKQAYLSVSGLRELTGKAVIEISQDASRTYSMTASVKNDTTIISDSQTDIRDNVNYIYTWNDGQTGATISNVNASDLIKKSVTVTADGFMGELKAQLEVPDKPDVKVVPDSNSLNISWNSPAARDNCPLPTGYVITIKKDGEVLKTVNADQDSTHTYVEGLEASTDYSVNVYAVSPVGRSDSAILTATTTDAQTPSTEDTTTEAPSTEAPSTEVPSTEVPSTEKPSTEEPSTEKPSTDDTSTEDSTAEITTAENASTEEVSSDSSEATSTEAANNTANKPDTGDNAALPAAIAVMIINLIAAGVVVKKRK